MTTFAQIRSLQELGAQALGGDQDAALVLAKRSLSGFKDFEAFLTRYVPAGEAGSRSSTKHELSVFDVFADAWQRASMEALIDTVPGVDNLEGVA